jgi:hypothetical protein
MLALKALRPHLYGTRRLEAGDEYEAPALEAIAHVANRRADFVKGPRKPAPVATPIVEGAAPDEPPVTEPEPMPEPEPSSIDDLRLQATQLGVDVDGRWGMARLRYEIEQAKR